MIRTSRAWIAHHRLQYDMNWRYVSAKFLTELVQQRSKKEKSMSNGG